jgi:aminoglycoside phosphotransferase family enzyme/predicted kinase
MMRIPAFARTIQQPSAQPPGDALAFHARLVEALRATRPFGHPVLRVEAIETHISTVLLAGEFAYKIKKPVDLGFVDFTTLEKRRQCCEDEVRLNRRTAPQLYLRRRADHGKHRAPGGGGRGEPIEYAVRMRRFAPEATFDALPLTPDQVDRLAALVATFHGSIPRAAPASGHGAAALIRETALDNFRQSRAFVEDRESVEALERLREVDRSRVRAARGNLRRATASRVRARVPWRPAPGQCRPDRRRAGTVRLHRVQRAAALDRRHERGGFHSHGSVRARRARACVPFPEYVPRAHGDYEGLAVLRFYLVYRALVRAKVAAIQRRRTTLERYLRVAQTLTRGAPAGLVVTCGLSGSGKTTLAGLLAGSLGAVRVRSDVERKRLHGLAAQDRAASAVGAGIYAFPATVATYERLAQLARAVLASGFPVIVDATFLRRSERRVFRDLARRIGVRFVIVRCEAPLVALRARLLARAARQDASDATPAVLERQLANREGFSPAEAVAAVTCDTRQGESLAGAMAEVEARLAD